MMTEWELLKDMVSRIPWSCYNNKLENGVVIHDVVLDMSPMFIKWGGKEYSSFDETPYRDI